MPGEAFEAAQGWGGHTDPPGASCAVGSPLSHVPQIQLAGEGKRRGTH